MRKSNLLLPTLALVVCLSGCSGISQSDYDTLLSEKETAISDRDSLQKDKEKLQKEKEELQEKVDELSKENEELKTANDKYLENEMNNAVSAMDTQSSDAMISSWAKTQWGDDTLSGAVDEAQTVYQVIIDSNYKTKDVREIQTNCGKAIASLNRLFSVMPSDSYTRCEHLYVRYLVNGDDYIEMTFKKKDGVFEFDTINMNAQYVNQIIEGLEQGGN